ncbi:MAG: DedA family protein [Acidimicrobiales bacterium]|nr:DedA family protein [Acidimicrobiales bacterium]
MGSSILDAVARLGGWWLCVAVLGVSFGESAVLLDFVIPGEVGMVVAGAAASRNDISPWVLIAFGSVGSILGDSFSYLFGRRWGMTLVRRWSWLRRRLEPLAGTSEMPYRRFLLWDAVAAVLWVTTMMWLGALLGDDIARVVDRVGTAISLVVVGSIILVLVVRARRKRPSGAGRP